MRLATQDLVAGSCAETMLPFAIGMYSSRDGQRLPIERQLAKIIESEARERAEPRGIGLSVGNGKMFVA